MRRLRVRRCYEKGGRTENKNDLEKEKDWENENDFLGQRDWAG